MSLKKLFEKKDALIHCPKCKGELKDGTFFYEYPTKAAFAPFIYCDKCDILRQTVFNKPVLCSRCHSTNFYIDRSDNKVYCWYCKEDTIVLLTDEEFSNLSKRRGYHLSTREVPNSSDCNHVVEGMAKKFKEKIFIAKCKNCKETEYVFVSEEDVKKHKIGDELNVQVNPEGPAISSPTQTVEK